MPIIISTSKSIWNVSCLNAKIEHPFISKLSALSFYLIKNNIPKNK